MLLARATLDVWFPIQAGGAEKDHLYLLDDFLLVQDIDYGI